MSMCLHAIGWVGTVLARGAQPCVLLCGLPDSRPGYRWHSVSALCSAGTLTQTIGHMDTWAQQMDIHRHANSHVYDMRMHFSYVRIHFYTKRNPAKWCTIVPHSPTVNYFQELCHVGSDNTHWQVSLPQGCLLTEREGQLAQAPDWELTHEVLSW